MFRIALCLALLSAMPLSAFAQATIVPAPPYYAMQPTSRLIPSARSPVQQQILEDYRTQLQQTQRNLLRHNPSGLDAAQIEVGRQLNAIGPGAVPPAPAAMPPPASFNPAPFAGGSALPAPPFDAAPTPAAGTPR
jgi:hypothetical protein